MNFGESKCLALGERKALADFIAGAGGRKKAFVEKELAGDKAGESRWTADYGFELVEAATWVFAARQRDMRLEGTSFRNEAAGLGGRGDTLLEQEQFGGGPYAGDENSGALEAVQSFKADGNGRRVQRAQARDDAGELIGACIAEKLQGDVPGFGRGPAEAISGGAKPSRG